MEGSGPLDRYKAAVAAGEIAHDDAQAEAAEHLQQLFQALNRPPPPAPGFLDRLLGKREVRESVRGLYFWGGVGRGKTFLMDLFYESLPFSQKRRLHFHRFMRHVHREMRELQGEANPLRKIASRFAGEARVLCFDEFFVSDITDAMILANLLESMFDNGITLVATSNVEPDRLYENGLQRRKFLPAIDLIKANTTILNVDGGVDYRLRALESAEIYLTPITSETEAAMAERFRSLSPDAGEENVTLEIEGRDIAAKRSGDGVAWFDFAALCEGPRSQNDYIELAMIYGAVLVSNVPVFTVKKEDAARRFISLVDEFYDHGVKLVLAAEAPILELYQGERLKFEFQRTESRLQEMQSHDYLAREHKPD